MPEPTETATVETPEAFDLDAWIAGSKRPRRSVRVYGRADLLADIEDLDRKIGIEQELEAEGEQSAGGNPVLVDLAAQRDGLVEAFIASRLDITVQALTAEEINRIGEEVKTALALKGRDDAKTPRQRDFIAAGGSANSLALLEAAIIAPAATFSQVAAMSDRIGDGQLAKVVLAWQQATYGEQEVSAPFSPAS